MRTLAAPLVCLVVLTACGSQGSDAATDGTGTRSGPPTMSSTSSTNDTGIVSVSLRRSGGLKPINVSRIFSTRTAPPKGYTAADVDQVIFAAQRFVGSGASVRPIVVSACCDRYTYAITIVWANGHSKTFTTTDGVAQPKLFDLLLRAVA